MKVSIVSFNLRYLNPGDTGPRSWASRKTGVLNYLRASNADLLALQEVLPEQRADLDQALSDYRSYGIGREGSGLGEQCCWFIRDPWWFEEATTFWLSPTPDQVSLGWDAMLPRVCSLVELRCPTGRLQAANVHLDHHGPQARVQGLDLVASRLSPERPALLVGDFNQDAIWSSVPLLQGWLDCQKEQGLAHQGTFHDFGGGFEGPRIDAILGSPHWQLESFGLDPDPLRSDHYPLRAELVTRQAC